MARLWVALDRRSAWCARRPGDLFCLARRRRALRFQPPQSVSAGTRSLSAVPPLLGIFLAASVAVHLAWQAWRAPPTSPAADLPPAPPAALLRAASFSEPEAAARIAMLYLQAYDLRGDNAVPYQHLDYERLIAWLRAIVATDPRSRYALFSAARVYTENPDAAKCRAMLEFLYAEFGRDPDRRWPWLAHAALV